MGEPTPDRLDPFRDIGAGCLGHLLGLAALFLVFFAAIGDSGTDLTQLVFTVYWVVIVVAVVVQFLKGRPYIALGLILAPLLVWLGFGGCVMIGYGMQDALGTVAWAV